MTEKLSASRAGRQMACPASANLDLAIPNWTPPVEDRTKDNAANRGTNMHEFFANIVELPAKDIHHMVSALAYVADLRSTRRFKVLSEVSVKANWLTHPTDTKADLVLYTTDEIHVIDLKTGRIGVEVIDNEQLLFYAVCYAPLAPQAKGVTLHIVQPWADGNQSWFADTARLAQFMDEALASEKRTLAHELTFGPSDHCMFCPAYPHSRGAKGVPLCPVTMRMLYPPLMDTDDILSL